MFILNIRLLSVIITYSCCNQTSLEPVLCY